MDSTYDFSSTLERWTTTDASWFFVTLPHAASDEIKAVPRPPKRGFGLLRVDVMIGATNWRTSIFPDSSRGRYLLFVKKSVRDAEHLDEGDTVAVSVTMLE